MQKLANIKNNYHFCLDFILIIYKQLKDINNKTKYLKFKIYYIV